MLASRVRNKLKILGEVTLPFRRVSFSATGEDILVADVFRRMGCASPFYFDIGANHPIRFNNTYAFYRSGGRGVCMEPQPALFEQIRRTRPRDECLNAGAAAAPSDPLPFFVFENPALSTFSNAHAEFLRHANHKFVETISIPLVPINDVLARCPPDSPSFVSIDCEGTDREILGGIDFGRHRPAVFCVETARPSLDGSPVLGSKIGEIDELFIGHGYWAFADTYVNTIYVDERRLRMQPAGPSEA
jgi:FkbM family methyltransferase